jgi:hypothetical protein
VRAGDSPPAPTTAAEPCPGCGGLITDCFCSRCGERRPSDRKFSLHELVEEAADELIHFDGTLLRTVRAIFSSPGLLTVAYMRGDRARYTRPLQLFFLANLAFFILSGPLHVRLFDTPLEMHLHTTPYRALATAMIDERLAKRGTTLAVYAPRFDAAATTQARSLVIVMVPVFALLVGALNRRRGLGALQHGVFALHFYVVFFAFFLGIAMTTAMLAPVVGAAALRAADPVLSAVTILVITAYLARAEQRVYGTSPIGGIVRGAALAVGALLVLGVYRGVLFFATFLTT